MSETQRSGSASRYVWAPHAAGVTLGVGSRHFPLRKQESGWWEGERVLNHGDDYQFILDGGEALPDPRSLWQPHGVTGPSRFVDHSRFSWTDAGWRPPAWEEAIVYELHIGTFTDLGTFEAAIERLDHLQELGITHVELMPVGQLPGNRGWGYDVVFPFPPQNTYGGPDGLKRLVDACHHRGLAVLLDVVYNHLGPSGNVLPHFGPYFSESHKTPWGPGLNFDDAGSDEVRRYVCDNALMWLRDYHIDGLRVDSVHEMVDKSALHILEQLVNEVRDLEVELGRDFVLTAEEGKNDPRYVRPAREGGYGFDAQWSNDVGLTFSAALLPERPGMLGDYGRWEDLVHVTKHPYVYERRYSQHRGHTFGRDAEFAAPSEIVVYAQNHDFLGNRRDGDRLGHLVDVSALKISSALTLLSPFTPLLFQGEEWNASSPFMFFADCHGDPELSEGVKKGRKMAAESLGWNAEEAPDPGARETFERSRLDWSELEKEPHREMLRWYRSLVALRRKLQAAPDADDTDATGDAASRCFTVKRGPLSIFCNLGTQARVCELSNSKGEVVLLSSMERYEEAGDGVPEVRLEPDSVVVVGPRDWAEPGRQVRERERRRLRNSASAGGA